MRNRNPQPAPDYTTAALMMIWANMMWVFLAIWALWGLIPVLLLGAGINRAIGWIGQRG